MINTIIAAEGKELSRIEESKIRAKANVSQSKESEEHVTEAEAAKALGIKHKVFGYSTQELQKKADGEKVFPHVFGTDDQGRDIMVRVMVATMTRTMISRPWSSVPNTCGNTFSPSAFF